MSTTHLAHGVHRPVVTMQHFAKHERVVGFTRMLPALLFLAGCCNCNPSSNLALEQGFSSSHCVFVVYSGVRVRIASEVSNVVCLCCRTCSWSTGTIHQVCWEETSRSLFAHSPFLSFLPFFFPSLCLYLSGASIFSHSFTFSCG